MLEVQLTRRAQLESHLQQHRERLRLCRLLPGEALFVQYLRIARCLMKCSDLCEVYTTRQVFPGAVYGWTGSHALLDLGETLNCSTQYLLPCAGQACVWPPCSAVTPASCSTSPWTPPVSAASPPSGPCPSSPRGDRLFFQLKLSLSSLKCTWSAQYEISKRDSI